MKNYIEWCCKFAELSKRRLFRFRSSGSFCFTSVLLLFYFKKIGQVFTGLCTGINKEFRISLNIMH